ncbi:hypothetical protein GCM10020256_22300 [Streptomyces thermocoprophilus]
MTDRPTTAPAPAGEQAPAAATRVLVLNSGSSSVKYQLLDMRDGSRLAVGLVERIGERTSRLKHTPLAAGGETRETNAPIADHDAALKAVAQELSRDGLGLDSPELLAIGHRVVHGGMFFTEPTVVTDEVIGEIERLIPVAPLHNPANLTGILTAQALRPDLPQVAVFDTAFHTTMPEAAARYAIDPKIADRYRIRRYGFHGTSHAYVSRGDGAAAGQGTRGRERDRAAPGQRGVRVGGARRSLRGHLHGADASGRAGDGYAFRRCRSGRRLPFGPCRPHVHGRDRHSSQQEERSVRAVR